MHNIEGFHNDMRIVSEGWVWRILANSASIGVGGTSAESNESLISPRGSPRVLDSPVIISGTNQKDSVVDVLGAVSEDTWSVRWPVGGINGNWNGSCWKRVKQVSASISVNVCCNCIASSSNLAWLIFSNIWIASGISDSFSDDEIKSRIHPSTIASLVSIWSGAVNKLLFR